ncbi:uncharacterized protein V1516DRAFT_676222 [Lipomyces oligophaga]|uniref:uncharacterized protein n=1 Tax=Lipomyces oligophaga TaxID=45792 RepID=UPI0034CFD1B8
MDALEQRLIRLEHAISPQTVSSTSALQQLTTLQQTLNTILAHHAELHRLFHPKVATSTTQSFALKSEIVIAHAADIAYLSSTLASLTSLSSVLEATTSTFLLETSSTLKQSNDLTELSNRINIFSSLISTQLIRSIALLERILKRSIIGATDSWAEFQTRIDSADRAIARALNLKAESES